MSKRPWYINFLKSDILVGCGALATIILTITDLLPKLGTSNPNSYFYLIALAAYVPFIILITIFLIRFKNQAKHLVENLKKAEQEKENLERENKVLEQEKKNLENCAAKIHHINHCYRDVLHEVFAEPDFKDSKEMIEKKTLQTACEKIAEIFSLFTGEKCTATIKLIRKHEGGKCNCRTIARSESNSERDRLSVDYEIDTNKNTAFDTARRYNKDMPSYFFSADLMKDHLEGKYDNERTEWRKYYRSTIVVPIRYMDYNSLGSDHAFNELGFLTIDTMATNKLNGNFHVQYLAGFADQMYNFMSLMRERYCLMRATQKKLSI